MNLDEINNANSSNIDVVAHCIDLIEKHLEILNEQKNVTSEAVQKTVDEGGTLLDYLKGANLSSIVNKSSESLGRPSGQQHWQRAQTTLELAQPLGEHCDIDSHTLPRA